MKKWLTIGLLVAVLAVGGYFIWLNRPEPPVETKFVQNVRDKQADTNGGVEVVDPGRYALVGNPTHVYQTFNNCGPATLTMVLNAHGANITQAELGAKMRPYQNQSGDNDDKTIFTYEFVEWAKAYNLEAIARVNGDIELLKKFTANGIPVVVKTWLNPGEDIGHFRLVRGFDENAQVIIQDDSYHGPNKRISYFDFLDMWQPFNYDYMLVYTSEQQPLVEAIVGEEIDEAVAWENAFERAEKERVLAPENVYPIFNLSTASYHLGNFRQTTSYFEQVENQLPRRMLWYQIEPIQAYKELGNFDRVFALTDALLSGGNRAFSELYIIRGQIYLSESQIDLAREQFELALKYNQNLEEAKQLLESI